MARKFKILVADDSLTYRMTVQELLADNDYEVILADDGTKARAIIIDELPDLAILDIVMPEIDGVALCQIVKANEATRHIPIILLTSKDNDNDKIDGLDAGADDYLTKPFNEEELLAKINTLLRLRSLQGDINDVFRKKSVVLVADDSLTVRMQLSELLEDGGYNVLSVENGVEALERVNRYLPDLVVLDVIMPEMNGIEVCRQIKKNPATLQIPVIIITSKNDINDKIQGLNAGADDYLYKPYNPKEFTAKVNAIFRMKKIQLEAERTMLARANIELQDVNKKLKTTQSQLVQNEKMVALGQLVAGIAHEINNPLSFVINNAQICQQALMDYNSLLLAYRDIKTMLPVEKIQAIDVLETDIDIEYMMNNIPGLFNDISGGLERIRRIVLDLRNFSRLDEAEKKRANIIEGIESTLNLISHNIKHRIDVIKEYANIPEVYCYPSQLNQVLMNVMVNAIQAMPDGGNLTIRTQCDASTVYIRIIDQGMGIPAELLSRVFEPFFTTKSVGSGTGLGLSISYGIMQKHKGTISYESDVGKGTTCTLTLPIDDDPLNQVV